MPVFKIHHITKYEYDRQVKESMNEIRIFPYQSYEQEILHHSYFITGQPNVQTFTDYWGNNTGIFNLLSPHKELIIESQLVVRTTASSQLTVNFHSDFDALQQEVNGHLKMLELSSPEKIGSEAAIDDIIQKVCLPDRSVAATIEQCCEYIYKNFKYHKGITDIETTVDDILDHRAGVCQDFAHLMLQILRTIKIPSRYVSGYICPHKHGMRGEGATHAWIEAWVPQYGWAGIDPTNNVWVTNNHVKLAVGRNFCDCSPIHGTFKGPAKQKLSVYVSVGYESGEMFEDINNVQMHAHSNGQEEDIPFDASDQQQ